MLARLRENLLYKLIALIFACLLHFYVVGQQNPSRTVTVPLSARSLPTDLLLDDKSLPQISLTLNGPMDELNRMSDSTVVAYIDLSHAHAGKNLDVPVQLRLPASVRADAIPDTVTVSIMPKTSRRLRVMANFPGAAPAGYTFRPPQVTPRAATVTGGQTSVDSVAQLVAKVDSGTAVGTVDDDTAIVPLDARGSQVDDVTVTPAVAHVLIEMVKVPARKTLLVSYSVIGIPPYPYKIADVQVRPEAITLSGRPESLAEVNTVTTVPIDVDGVTSDVTRRVACVLPPGIAVVGPNLVTVTVHIVAQQQPVAPPPIIPSEPPASGTAKP